MKTTVISIHSAFGGVGKTQIALTSALQLAMKGCKVALIDLSAPGNGLLSQWLGSIFHHQIKKSVFEYFSYGGKAKSWLLPSSSTRKLPGVAAQNLRLFPGSPLPKITTVLLNRIAIFESGPASFFRQADNLINELAAEQFRYIILDNAAGLYFLPGVVFAHILSAAARKKEDTISYELWFTTRENTTEIGMAMHELAIYGEFLNYVSPRLIINMTSTANPLSVDTLASNILNVPVWKEFEQRIKTEEFVLWLSSFFGTFRFSRLGFDAKVQREEPTSELVRIINYEGVLYGGIKELLTEYGRE